MHEIRRLMVFIALVVGLVILAVPAQAQLLHTWVASNGNDGSNCDRSTPCQSFQVAYQHTAPGGEITCLDSGNFGGIAAGQGLTMSITVNCEEAMAANGDPTFGWFSINTPAGSSVTLRGLQLDGTVAPTSGYNSIQFQGAGTLHLRKVRIHNNGVNGILFIPKGTAVLDVSDCDISDNGSSGNIAGIYVKPASGIVADIYINNSLINNNFFGIIADGSGGGIIGGVVRNSVVSGNKNTGITTYSGGASVTLVVQNSSISGNGYGLAAAGPNAAMFVTRSGINYNGTGVFGPIYSYGDNSLLANGADGSFAGTIGPK